MASARPQYGEEIIFWFLIKLLFFGESKILLDKFVGAVSRVKTASGVASCLACSLFQWSMAFGGFCCGTSIIAESLSPVPLFRIIKNLPPYAHSMKEDSFFGFL